jgi:hypothetical protein
MALVRRLFGTLLGYFAASLAAGAILIAFELQEWSNAGLNLPPIWLIVDGFLNISGFLLLPALVLFAITEALYIRAALAYAVLGALGLVLLACFVGLIRLEPATHLRDAIVAAIMTGAGIVAGIVYWSVAGRNAGSWREPPPLPSQMPSPGA